MRHIWDVYCGGRFIGSTMAVSEAQAVNNVNYKTSMIKNGVPSSPNDGAEWYAVPRGGSPAAPETSRPRTYKLFYKVTTVPGADWLPYKTLRAANKAEAAQQAEKVTRLFDASRYQFRIVPAGEDAA